MSAGRTQRILVINPNSNEDVTHGIKAAVEPMAVAGGLEIECVTLREGPIGIETQADVESVALPLRSLISSDQQSDAFVIACYSDPGLHVCREAASKPVFGINECAVLTALAQGDRFGVLAIKEASVRRHMRYLRQLGLLERFAGERPLNMSVAETASGIDTLERMITVGQELQQQDGADVIIMGCAGMARHRKALEAELGVPVVDPCQAAVTMAVGAVLFN